MSVLEEVQQQIAVKEAVTKSRNATSDAVNDLTDMFERAADGFFGRLLERDAREKEGVDVLGVRPEPADGHRVLVVKLAMGDRVVREEDFAVGYLPVWGWVSKKQRSTGRVFATPMVLDTDVSDDAIELGEYIDNIEFDQPVHYKLLAPSELELDAEELSLLKKDLADQRYRRNRESDAKAALRQKAS